MKIRPAGTADVPLITACVDRAYRHYVERIGKPPRPMVDDYDQVLKRRQVWVMEIDQAIVGLLVLDITDEGFYLDNIAVDPSYQGKGFGRTLLAFSESEARRQDHDSIYLCTNVKMTENQEIYKHYGYIEYDRRAIHGHAAIFMRKNLIATSV